MSVPVASEETFVIPSVAIHFNRSANDGIKLNPQTDMMPLIGLDHAIRSVKELFAQRTEGIFSGGWRCRLPSPSL